MRAIEPFTKPSKAKRNRLNLDTNGYAGYDIAQYRMKVNGKHACQRSKPSG